MQNHDQTPKSTIGPNDLRTLNVMMGTGTLNQIDQTRKAGQESGPVQGEKREVLPLPLRLMRGVGGLVLLAGIVGLIACFIKMNGERPEWALPAAKYGLGIGVPLYGGLLLLEAWLDRRAWLRRSKEKQE